MKKLVVLLPILVFFFANNASADFNGTIKQIVCHANGVTPACFVSVNGTPTQSPACAISDWKYSFDASTTEGKSLLSILLAAQLSKTPITIGGKGSCTLSPVIEDLRHAYMTTTL